MMIRMINSIKKDKAAPSGQLKTLVNWSSMMVPMKVPSLPPRILGSIKDPTTGIKIRTLPAAIPGNERGTINLINIIILLAPNTLAASMMESSID